MIYKVAKMKDVYTILSELAKVKESEIDVFIPSGALILQNRLNLQFLISSLEKLGKTVNFETDDVYGTELINQIKTSDSADFSEVYAVETRDSEGFLSSMKSIFSFVSLKNLPKIPKPNLTNFSFKLNFVLLGILMLVVLVGVYGVNRYVSSQKAYIKLITKAEPIARSLTVRVDSEETTNAEEKTLEGKIVSTVLFEETSIETTGERIVGEKAVGTISTYNRMEEEIDLEEGTEVVYKGDDEGLVFILTEDVTVPPLSYEIPEDPASPMTPGEAAAEVEALEIGEKYNIDDGKTLEFNGYERSELVAKSDGDFEGGSEEYIAIVSEEDITVLLEKVRTKLAPKAEPALEEVIPLGYKMIQGSGSENWEEPEISHEVEDEAEEIFVRQSLGVSALTYPEKELDQLIMNILGEYVPEEYSLSGGKHTLNVEVLGRTEDTVLSATTADLQVTVKTTVVPDIDIAALKKELAGASIEDVQREIGSMNSVSTYELNLSPGVPFKSTIPKDTDKILIEIEEG